MCRHSDDRPRLVPAAHCSAERRPAQGPRRHSAVSRPRQIGPVAVPRGSALRAGCLMHRRSSNPRTVGKSRQEKSQSFYPQNGKKSGLNCGFQIVTVNVAAYSLFQITQNE